MVQMAKDFDVEEKYFYKFKNEQRSVRYSFNPLIFCLIDYISEDTGKIHIVHLLFIIKNNMLLLVVAEQSKYFKELFDTVIEKTKKRKLKSETYILYEFLNQDTKENYEVIENIDDKLAELEKKIIANQCEEKLMHQVDLIETQKETVTDLLEVYTTTLNNKLADISNKLNTVMKKMAALTIIMMPTMIASVYGTNFKFLPEISWKYGYLWLWAAMTASALFTWYLFHKKGWI